MKKTLALLAFAFFAFVPNLTHASGKLIAQGTSYFLDGGHKIAPSVGLSIYEKLGMDRVALNSWIGYGRVARETLDVEWINMSHFIEFYVGRFTIGAGYKFNADPSFDNIDHGAAVKLAYKLWD